LKLNFQESICLRS